MKKETAKVILAMDEDYVTRSFQLLGQLVGTAAKGLGDTV